MGVLMKKNQNLIKMLTSCLFAFVLFALLVVPCLAATTELPTTNDIFLKVANDAGARFDPFGSGNDSYFFYFPEADKDLNSVHISTSYSDKDGQTTRTSDMSGSFYITNTGGVTYKDDALLLFAVNGSSSAFSDFNLTVTSSGYQWTPVESGDPTDVTYTNPLFTETFDQTDFLTYSGTTVKQTWKPYNYSVSNYPLYEGQDVSDGNKYYFILIDLKGGIVNDDTLAKRQGALKVDYVINGMPDTSYGVFNAYVYQNTTPYRTSWTTRTTESTGKTVSGYIVYRYADPGELTTIVPDPQTLSLGVGYSRQYAATGYDQYGATMSGLTFSWSSSNTTVGTISSSGLFTALKAGTTTITVSSGGVTATSAVTITASAPSKTVGTGGDYATIQAAIDAVSSGYTIIIKDGTYSENIDVDKQLTILGENGAGRVNITASSAGDHVINITSNYVNITGCNISGATSSGFAGIYVQGDNTILLNNVISGCDQGLYLESSDGALIRGNNITGTTYSLQLKQTAVNNNIYQNSFFGTVKISKTASGNIFSTSGAIAYSFDNGSTSFVGSNRTGNYWSGYSGSDADTIGIGSSVYAIDDNNNDNYPLTDVIGNYTFGASVPSSSPFTVGTSGYDFTSIQDAVTAANPGYTINVYPGTYEESVTIDKALAIQSVNGASGTILNATGESGFTVTGSSINLSGFTIKVPNGGSGGAIYLNGGSDCFIFNNNISESNSVGIQLKSNANNNTIFNNTVSVSTDKKVISLKSGDDNRVYQNSFIAGKNPADEGSRNIMNTSSRVRNYVYNGTQSTSFFGNYWFGYSGTDADGNGIGDTAYTSDGLTDSYPLMAVFSSYYLNGGNTGNVSRNSTLSQNGVEFSGTPGSQTVDANISEATTSGNTIVIEGGGFTFNITTTGSPTTSGGNYSGTVAFVNVTTTPISSSFTTAGAVEAHLTANLTGLPSGAEIDSLVTDVIPNSTETAFGIAASTDGFNLGNIGYLLTVTKSTGFDSYLNDAIITMKISESWVSSQGGPDGVRIFRQTDDGVSSILSTSYSGPIGGQYIFTAESPGSLCSFGVGSVSSVSGGGSTSSGSGGRDMIGISRVDKIKEGEMAFFNLEDTAIYQIVITAKEDIPAMMITSSLGKKPDGADAPDGALYQYIKVDEYYAPTDSISVATLRFHIPESWLEDHATDGNFVSVVRYDENEEKWVPLSTVYTGETNGLAEFFADTASFSYFAIVAEEDVVTKPTLTEELSEVTPQPTITASTSESGSVTQSPVQAQTTSPQQTPLFPSITSVLVGVILLLVLAVSKRYGKKKSCSQDSDSDNQ